MTEKEALEEIIYFNKWRRGADIPQPDPFEVGTAIEIAIEALKNKIKENEDKK